MIDTPPSPRLLRSQEVEWLQVERATDPGAVRRRAADLAQRVGLSPDQVAKVAIVATELATNLVTHAVDGAVVLRLLRHDSVGGLEIVAVDGGPGVRDIASMFVDGSTTSTTLGIGLGAVQRLATRHDEHSTPGQGTVVTASFWAGDAPDEWSHVAGLTKALTGEDECGDAYSVRTTAAGWLLLTVDGLGHGPRAARAATEAVRLFQESDCESPADLISILHAGLASTRGAAVAIGSLDLDAGRLTYAGVGNITGRIVTEDSSRGLLSFPGIVGHNARTIRESGYDVAPGAWVILHTDGLNHSWNPASSPGLLTRSALVVAATLMRDASILRDDAGVLVARCERP